MRYLLPMYGEEANGETPTAMPPERAAAWDAFWRDVANEIPLRGWAALEPTTAAQTLRPEGGELVTLDGPFAETKEQLGGFLIIECDDPQQARDFAARVPCGPHGSIEIRAIAEQG